RSYLDGVFPHIRPSSERQLMIRRWEFRQFQTVLVKLSERFSIEIDVYRGDAWVNPGLVAKVADKESGNALNIRRRGNHSRSVRLDLKCKGDGAATASSEFDRVRSNRKLAKKLAILNGDGIFVIDRYAAVGGKLKFQRQHGQESKWYRNSRTVRHFFSN